MTVHILEGIPADSPTHRRNIGEMSQDETMLLLDGIRVRRLAAYNQYKAAAEAKVLYKHEQDVIRMNQQMRLFEKELATLDKALAKVEKRSVSIAALRLEIEP